MSQVRAALSREAAQPRAAEAPPEVRLGELQASGLGQAALGCETLASELEGQLPAPDPLLASSDFAELEGHLLDLDHLASELASRERERLEALSDHAHLGARRLRRGARQVDAILGRTLARADSEFERALASARRQVLESSRD